MNQSVAALGLSAQPTPLKVKELPAFLAAIEPIAKDLQAGDLMAALLKNAEALITATAIGARVERAWLEEQTPDALVELAGQVIEVNLDFFTQKILPQVTAFTARLPSTPLGERPTVPAP